MIVEIRGLTVRYGPEGSGVRAVDHVSLDVDEGILYGIVGESGSGKSTIAMAMMGLLPHGASVEGGSISIDGFEVTGRKESQLASFRGRTASLVFQGAMNNLNPLMRIEDQVAETLLLHRMCGRKEALERARRSLELVGLGKQVWRLYPHELSGGMKQRAMIAAAVVAEPRVLIADEPTTALDVITQVQIVNLLRQLREKLGMTVILISHDFPLVSEASDRICILYGGKVCEVGSNSHIVRKPLHPYTAGLLNSVVSLRERREIMTIPGEPVDLSRPPKGCRFMPRCGSAMEKCSLYAYDSYSPEPGRLVYCEMYSGPDGNTEA